MQVRDTVVIGGGVAGCTAAMYATRYGLDAALVEMLAPGGQATTATTIENYPGFPEGIQGPELAMRVHQQAQNVGVDFVTAEARQISETPEGYWLIETSHDPIPTISIIIATGAFPRSLQVPGEKELRGKGVSYCATCDGFFYRGQTIAVVGGGNSAIEEALYLSDIAEKVYVIHRRDELRADSYLQERILKKDNVEVLWDTIVTAIEGDGVVERLALENTKSRDSSSMSSIEVSGIFIAIGHIAKTEWLEGLVDLKDGFIVTNQLMESSRSGIFACGDIRNTPLRQIATAVGDAAIAAFGAHAYVGQWKAQHESD